MKMAVTKIADVIQPELFADYVIDRTTEKSEIMNAGVVESNPELNKLISGGGTILTMPKWNDLTGKSQVLSEDKAIEVGKITSKSEMATLLIRASAWGAHELAGALAGDDPMKRIGELVSDWWVRDEKSNIMSILNGIFASTATVSTDGKKMSDLVLDASTKNIGADVVLDGKQLMGDASDLLTMIYMHSATFTQLQKQNVIQFIPVAESKIQIPTYLGYRVVVDDSAPITEVGETTKTKVYTSYLLSRGCIQRGMGKPDTLTEVETDRDSLGSTDILINRQAKILHPKGISWVGGANITDATPSDAELATGANWKLVADIKKIGIVKILHKIGE